MYNRTRVMESVKLMTDESDEIMLESMIIRAERWLKSQVMLELSSKYEYIIEDISIYMIYQKNRQGIQSETMSENSTTYDTKFMNNMYNNIQKQVDLIKKELELEESGEIPWNGELIMF